MNGDKSLGGGQAPMVQPKSGTVDVEQSLNSSSSGGDSPKDPDWRAQLTLEDRQRIVDQLLETLEKHLSSAQEGDRGLKKIAGRYEEKIYSAVTTSSRSDYLRKISSTMHALERNSQVPMSNSLQTGAADASRISSDLASNSTQSPSHSLGLSMPIVGDESRASQNMQNNVSAGGVQNSGSLASTLPAVSNLAQGSLANTVCQDSSLQNDSSVAEKSFMKQKLQPGDMKWNQNLLQTGQIQSSQQAVMQPTMMQAASISGLEQNQQSSAQQSFQQMPDKLPQPVLGQHQQQPMPKLHIPHQQQTSMAPKPMMQTAQQTQLQPLTGQVSSGSGIQQNQLLENIQFLSQGLGLMSQQNNNANLQQQRSISQLNNIPNTHQLQLGGGVSGGVQQSTIPGLQSISSSEMPNLQQNVPVQQQVQQNVSSLENQTQQPQSSQPQTVSHVQPQLVLLPHVQLQSNSMQCNMSQKLPTSGAMLQQQNLVSQEKQFCQSQQAIQKAPSAQIESSGAGDWQEEAYQKIKSMKDAYLVELNAMYSKITIKLQTQGVPQQCNNEQLSKIKFFKIMLERLVQFVQMSKNEVQKDHKDKLGSVEKQIISILNTCKPTPLQPGQLPQPCLQNSQLQSQISQMQPQPFNPQPGAATLTQNTSSAPLQNMSSSVPITRSLMYSLQQPSSTFGLHQNISPLSLQLPQISQMPTQSSNPQTSAATMTHNNFSALHQNTLSSVPSYSNSMTNPVQQPSFMFGLGQNSSMLSPQNIALSGPQSSNLVRPLLSSQAGVNALSPNLNSLSLQTCPGLLQNPYPNQQLQQPLLPLNQQQMKQQLQYQQRMLHQQMQQQAKNLQQVMILQQQVMNLQPSAQLPGHPSPQINQQNLVASLTKTETPLHSANPSVAVTASSTPVAASRKHGESEKVNASPSPLSKNTTKAAGSSNLTQAPGHPSLKINQHNAVTSLTNTWKPLHSADSLATVPSASTHAAPSPVHAESEKVIASLPSHLDTVTGHIQTPNSAGSSIANTNTGHLESPNAARSSVLPLQIFIGDSEIVNASLSSQPNTHILHLEAPNPTDSSAKPLAISITISIA